MIKTIPLFKAPTVTTLFLTPVLFCFPLAYLEWITTVWLWITVLVDVTRPCCSFNVQTLMRIITWPRTLFMIHLIQLIYPRLPSSWTIICSSDEAPDVFYRACEICLFRSCMLVFIYAAAHVNNDQLINDTNNKNMLWIINYIVYQERNWLKYEGKYISNTTV